ncbi:hypothetical protein BDF21DRAFT_459412 [Thamnidium elegans]|nr:hypothetical protein BDF21DRAFT_459412 [Thamnidium elegans]
MCTRLCHNETTPKESPGPHWSALCTRYVDADHDTVMLEAWHTDDIIMEEIWRKDVQNNDWFLNNHRNRLEQQGKQFTYRIPITNSHQNLFMLPPNQLIYHQTEYLPLIDRHQIGPPINHQQVGPINQSVYQTQSIDHHQQLHNPFFFQKQFSIIHHQLTGLNQAQFSTINCQSSATPTQQTNRFPDQAQVPNINQGQGSIYRTGNRQLLHRAKSTQRKPASDIASHQTQEGSTILNQEPIQKSEGLQESLEKEDPLDDRFKNTCHLRGGSRVFIKYDNNEPEQASDKKSAQGGEVSAQTLSTSETSTPTFSNYCNCFPDKLEAYDPYGEGSVSDSEVSLSTEEPNSPVTCDLSTQELNIVSKRPSGNGS